MQSRSAVPAAKGRAMKRQAVYWDKFERAAARRQCGCRARGRAILRILGDGIVLAMLLGIIALTLYVDAVP